ESVAHRVERSELRAVLIGRELTELWRSGSLRRTHRIDPVGPPYYSARRLAQREVLAPTDLDLHRGEVVGIAGLRGSGRTELARLLAGGAIADSGSAVLDGHAIALRSPGGALRHHIAMASED